MNKHSDVADICTFFTGYTIPCQQTHELGVGSANFLPLSHRQVYLTLFLITFLCVGKCQTKIGFICSLNLTEAEKEIAGKKRYQQ